MHCAGFRCDAAQSDWRLMTPAARYRAGAWNSDGAGLFKGWHQNINLAAYAATFADALRKGTLIQSVTINT
jgi:hypothetical protein